MSKKYTHSELVEMSRKWLVRKGFPIVINEMAGVGEEADALGFNCGRSTLIECKVSRSDFLSDKKKCFRQNPEFGVGDYRYYCAPKDMIKPEELPENWGLIETTSGTGLRVKIHARFPIKKNHQHEMCLLMSVIRRIGGACNPQKAVSIKVYTYSTQNRASVSIDTGEQQNLCFG